MEPSNNTETEEETIAFKRKRARRVSFADNEITSVHIFRPDDDHSSSSSDVPAETLGLFRELAGDSDDEDADRRRNSTDGAADAVDHINSFLQPLGSPSPGGSSINADEDTDDDEFRGPVSTDFIKPERLSDSGVSDDITMDSTAFSMHYRSIARSDSGDLKTPTRFDATMMTTAGQSGGTPGSFMELTDREKKQLESPVVASGGGDSDDMSIEGEKGKTYDYGRLSPSLVSILAQGSKDLQGVSPLGSKATHSPIANHVEVLLNLECSANSPVHQITHDTAVASASESSTKNTKEFVNGATPPVCKQLDSVKANRGTPPKMDEGDKLDLAAKFELGFCEGPVNENNSKDKGQVTDSNHKSDQVSGNHPEHGFTPLSLSAAKLPFMGSPDSFRSTGNITTPLKQSGLVVPEVHVTNSATLSSIRKSISKLKPFETTPNTSTLKEENALSSIRKSISKLKTLETTPNASTLKEENALSSIRKSISKLKTLETTPNTSTLKEGNDKLKRRLSKYSPGTSFFNEKGFQHEQVETLTAPLEEQPFSLTKENNMHQSLINTDDHLVDSLIEISKLSQNEETMATKKNKENFSLVSANVSYNDENLNPVDVGASPLLKTHVTRVADFNLADSTVEKRKDETLTAMHSKPFSSPVKSFDHNLSPSVECQSNSHGELKQLEMQNECVNSGLGQAIEYDKPTVAKDLDLSGVKKSEEPSTPFEDAQSASKGKPSGSPSNRFLVLSSSPIKEATTVLPSLQEPPSELFHNNILDLSHRINSDGHGVDLVNNYHPALQVSQSPLTKSGIEVSSGKKRKGIEILSDGDNIAKIGRIGRSPEVHKSGNGDLQFVLEQTGYMRSEREKFGDQKLNDWDNILKRFSTSTKQVFSPSLDKLNLRLIGMLEYVLVHLQKVKKWDILSSEIHSQKLTDPRNISRHKRFVEMKMLLFNIAYESAKLQLMNVKRERLLKKVQQLSSGLQEIQMMKNFMPCSAKSGTVDIEADDSHINSRLLTSQGNCQVSCTKVMEMRQELESLNQKAKSLSEFFYGYCKMEGDQSCTNIVKSVPDYLEKRMTYKLVFQNLKLWDIEDFERKDDYHIITLNYCGYIIQRLTVNAGLSSIIVSNSLNDVNIGKTYPNMDAFSAFAFALNSHTPSKSTGRISMAQETQITGSLLSNLLDVVEEVQLARIEVRNLVQAKFNSHSVHQLDLQLSFIDFRSGKNVQVIFDMTCLKCGVYPAEVLPSQISDPAASGEQKALPLSLVDTIRTAAEGVRVGYSRIIRLCRCISQAVQAYTQDK